MSRFFILDLRIPYEELDGKADADYVLQRGHIYCWSESNCRYERAWWLNPDGTPVNDTPIVRNVCEQRPFKVEWLCGKNLSSSD